MLFSGYECKENHCFHSSDSQFKHDDRRRCASLLLDVLGDSLYVPSQLGRVGEMTGYSCIPMIFYYFLISIHIKRSCIKVFINSINHGIILMAHVMQSSNDVLSLSAYEARLGTSTEFMINNGWLTMTRHGPNRSDMISSWSKALDAPNTCGNSS